MLVTMCAPFCNAFWPNNRLSSLSFRPEEGFVDSQWSSCFRRRPRLETGWNWDKNKPALKAEIPGSIASFE